MRNVPSAFRAIDTSPPLAENSRPDDNRYPLSVGSISRTAFLNRLPLSSAHPAGQHKTITIWLLTADSDLPHHAPRNFATARIYHVAAGYGNLPIAASQNRTPRIDQSLSN